MTEHLMGFCQCTTECRKCAKKLTYTHLELFSGDAVGCVGSITRELFQIIGGGSEQVECPACCRCQSTDQI